MVLVHKCETWTKEKHCDILHPKCTTVHTYMIYMHFLTGRGWSIHSKIGPIVSMCNIPEQWGHVRKWLDWFPAYRTPNSKMLFTSHLPYSNSAPTKTLATQHTCNHPCCQHPCPSSAKHTGWRAGWVPTSEVDLQNPGSISFSGASAPAAERWQQFQSMGTSTATATAHCCPGCWISWEQLICEKNYNGFDHFLADGR